MTIRRAHPPFVRILWLVLAALLSVAQLAIGQSGGSAWEGAGAVGSSSEFPPAGLYAASDTFPRNSIVDVLNLDTGENVRILVVKKLNVPGLFMLVSPDAAKSLGMSSSGTSRLRVTPVMMPGLADMNLNRDLPYSPDPDINPAASVANPNAAVEAARGQIAAAPQAAARPETPAPRPEPPAVSAAPAPLSAQTVPAPEKPESPQQDLLAPGAASAARAAGNTTPQAGAEVVPRVAAGPEASLPATLPPVQPTPPAVAEAPSPSAATKTTPVTSGAAAAGPAAPLPSASPQTAYSAEIGNPAVPQAPQSIAEATPEGRTPPSQELPGGGVAIPSSPSGAATAQRTPQPAANLYSTPDEGNPAQAEISRLEDRTPQKALFVPPRPEDTAIVLSPPPAPSQQLTMTPNELAVAVPPGQGHPVAGTLPQLSAPPEGQPNFISQLPGTPGAPKVAQTAPSANQSPGGPEASQIVPPSRYQEPALPGTLPIAQAPGTETPSISDMQLKPAPESLGNGNLPVASAPGTEKPELGGLGPVAPPKPAAAVAEAFQPPSPSTAPQTAEKTPSAPETPVSPPGTGAITLVPAEPRSPVSGAPTTAAPKQAPAPSAVATSVPAGEAWAQRNLPLVSVLQSNYYYVQIGAFESPQSAKDALDRVAPGYPMVVLPVKEHGRTVYRLFVGPLNDDEKGAALYWFKAKGYNDAFVRRGGES